MAGQWTKGFGSKPRGDLITSGFTVICRLLDLPKYHQKRNAEELTRKLISEN